MDELRNGFQLLCQGELLGAVQPPHIIAIAEGHSTHDRFIRASNKQILGNCKSFVVFTLIRQAPVQAFGEQTKQKEISNPDKYCTLYHGISSCSASGILGTQEYSSW